MPAAPHPDNEIERLEALRQYNILDTRAEQDFDDLTELAAHICGTPIALVSLLDSDRQWFKSRFGIDAPQTPRDHAFCGYAILQDEVLEVPDATQDLRFQDNPLVLTDPNIRFYAGSPLVNPDGLPVGTLCVIDRVPRTLTDEQRKALAALGRQVVAQLELRKNLASLANTVEDLESAQSRLAETNRELARKSEEAERASQSKSSFLANMSHELRTPLNAIIGYSEMLQEEAEDTGQDALVPDLEKIRGAGKHLLELINDILDLSKIEAGKMTVYPEKFELPALIKEVCATSAPLLEKNGNALSLEITSDSGTVYSDRTKIRQCLFNLISNAAKFTDRGTITLTASTYDSDGVKRLRVDVADTGIGMRDEQLNRIFEVFAQADDSTTRRFGGTGLGLSITKKMCEMLGGTIHVASRPNHGSTFTMDILQEMPGTNASQPALSGKDSVVAPDIDGVVSSGMTVLVIDDDDLSRELIVRKLENEPYTILEAGSGERGLQLARETQPNLILLDVMMPHMDGWEVLKSLKGDDRTKTIPVVMVSMMDGKELGVALGATEYVMKPVEKDQLSTIVATYCAANHSAGPVLVVDDDAGTRRRIRSLLEKGGFTIEEASNGQEAIKLLERTTPALMLLDLTMPVLDGFGVLEHLRRDKRFHELPVVVLTARDLDDADRQRLEGYVREYLIKGSVDRTDILACVKQYALKVASTS